MTKSERLCEKLGILFFFKEMVKSNLVYITEDKEEKELADLILRVGKYILLIQIKEKDDNGSDIKKWLENKVYKRAKQQIKKSYIELKKTLKFKDSTNTDILEDLEECCIILIIIFDVGETAINYNRSYHSEQNNMLINIFSIIDFELMCHKLISPMEMIEYIKERVDYLKTPIIYHENVFAKTNSESAMLDFYIIKHKLRIEENINKLIKFNIYLSDFEEHCINSKKNYSIFIKKMSSFTVKKIYAFIDRIERIICKGNSQEISWSNFIIDHEQSILFISFPIEKKRYGFHRIH